MIPLPSGETISIWSLLSLALITAGFSLTIYLAVIHPYVIEYKQRKAFRQLGDMCKEMADIFNKGPIDKTEIKEKLGAIEKITTDLKQ